MPQKEENQTKDIRILLFLVDQYTIKFLFIKENES